MTSQGRSLELFFVDGRPDGMLTAEVFNWTGHVLRTPRTQLKEALARPEAGYTGVYILFGEQEDHPLIYVGEAEDMRLRLRDHAAKKEWWDFAILITTSANNLHKAHVKYLESRLVEIATDVGAARLDNGNIPPRSSLNEAARANMESFIDTLMMVLPAIRVDAFLQKKVSRAKTADLFGLEEAVLELKVEDKWPQAQPIFELISRDAGALASAQLIDGEMVVLVGSRVRVITGASCSGKIIEKRDQLIERKVLVPEEGWLVFKENYAFNSPSGAADFINGYSTNGRLSWKEKQTGKSYAAWESAMLDAGAETK